MLKSILSLKFDWPNLLAGAAIAFVASLFAWLVKGLYGYYIIARDLPYKIWGIWFSAEFDPKGFIQADLKIKGGNTFLKVRVEPRLGRKIVVRALGPVENLTQIFATKWTVHSRLIKGDTIVGTWRSTVKYTKRYGTAIIKFIDNGRAVGYWTGLGTTDEPLYGYWIMSRDIVDIKRLASEVHTKTNFEVINVSSFVINYHPPISQ